MEFVTVLALVVLIQCAQGFFNPYQTQYFKEVPISWPYNHYYYPAYPQQPKQFQVSLFLVVPSIICKKIAARPGIVCCKDLQCCQMTLLKFI